MTLSQLSREMDLTMGSIDYKLTSKIDDLDILASPDRKTSGSAEDTGKPYVLSLNKSQTTLSEVREYSRGTSDWSGTRIWLLNLSVYLQCVATDTNNQHSGIPTGGLALVIYHIMYIERIQVYVHTDLKTHQGANEHYLL